MPTTEELQRQIEEVRIMAEDALDKFPLRSTTTPGAVRERHIHDLGKHPGGVIAARVHNTGTQTISTGGAGAALTFDSERYDTDDIHSTSSNTSRLTAKTAGKYDVLGSVLWAANSTNQRIIFIRQGGSTQWAKVRDDGSAAVMGQQVSAQIDLKVDDYLELIVFQDSGGDLDTVVESNNAPEFMMARVGAAGTSGGGTPGTDHGALTGLGDDDHSVYLLAAGTRAGSTGSAQDFGSTGIKTDIIAESTSTSGVTIDSALLKDGNFQFGTSTGLIKDSGGDTRIQILDTGGFTFTNSSGEFDFGGGSIVVDTGEFIGISSALGINFLSSDPKITVGAGTVAWTSTTTHSIGGTDIMLWRSTDVITTAPLICDVPSDSIALLVKGHSTQTANIFEVEDKDAVNLFTVSDAGNGQFAGTLRAVGDATFGSAGNLVLKDGSITDGSGTIDFGNEILKSSGPFQQVVGSASVVTSLAAGIAQFTAKGDTTNKIAASRMDRFDTGAGSFAGLDMISGGNAGTGFSFQLQASNTDFHCIDRAAAGDPSIIMVEQGTFSVGIGNDVTAPTATLHVDQTSTTGAQPTLLLDQADVDEDLLAITGTSVTTVADATLVEEAEVSSAGALTGWMKVKVVDTRSGGITDGDYYIQLYAAPTMT